MVDIRTVSLPGIWAEDAQTTIPTPPIANTTYRNLEWGETEANQGWPFQKIVDSADFNQAMWYLFTLQKMQEQFGILPWCSTTEYKQGGLTIGSNGIFYVAVQDNTAQNPVSDSSNTYWKVFIDPSQTYATSGYVDGQIALCEKLANKVQALSASSTIDQYPSAKAVWDNLALKQTIANMVQSVSASSTTTQYPSAKAVWDAVAGFSPSLYELVANKAQDLTSPSATTYPSTQAVANESDRIIDIMDIKRKLNYGTAFDISGSFYVGSPAYKVTVNGILCVSIKTSSQTGPQVNLRIANSGTASASSPVFAVWGHNGGGAEHNIAPVTIPVFRGNSCYLEKVGGGDGSLVMAAIIPYYDN